jgi:hypothetical protein
VAEAIAIRLHRARSWVRKADQAGDGHDLDAQFIFLWIAFNALYGVPRYRLGTMSNEIGDIAKFLAKAGELGPTAKVTLLIRLRSEVATILRDPFLSVRCWRKWDAAGVRNRAERIALCDSFDRSDQLIALFRRLYTLRNQILHGAATDRSKFTRETLRAAIEILRTAVPAFVELVKLNHRQLAMLEDLPYPPSHGDNSRFNTPHLKSAAREAAAGHSDLTASRR